MKKLLALETHPIQYRAPIFRCMEQMRPGCVEVAYASDFCVRGYRDAGFGETIAWDIPLMAGYPNRVMNNERGHGIAAWNGLTGRGVDELISSMQPDAILLHSLSYQFTQAAYWASIRRNIPIWIRLETQDEAFERGMLKSAFRHVIYRALYSRVSRAFYIGELNRRHLLASGIAEQRLRPALYCTSDPLRDVSAADKQVRRDDLRARIGLPQDAKVVAFFGKLIPKKAPDVLFRAVAESDLDVTLLIVGSGELEASLRREAEALFRSRGIRTLFAGFVNQSALPDYYLASDIVVLPSLRMGETWGLVVNEGLQAGCGIAVSDAVGSHADFAGLERLRVARAGDPAALARALAELVRYPRDFDWAAHTMQRYSVEAAASALCAELDELDEKGTRA